MPSWIYILVVMLVFLLSSMIKVASDNERYALFKLGQFMELKGPGIVFKSMGSESKFVKMKVGETGELSAPTIGEFKDVQLPVAIDSGVKVGSIIRIIGFNEKSVKAMMNPDQRRTVKCDKCGHEITI